MAHWEGVDDSLDALDDLADGASNALAARLRAEGELIMTDVKASRPGKGVPRDIGTLASTGTVSQPKPHRVELTFGGPAAPYAVVQHERVDYQHDLGEAKYLERGLQRRQQGQDIAKAMKEHLDAVQQVVKTT